MLRFLDRRLFLVWFGVVWFGRFGYARGQGWLAVWQLSWRHWYCSLDKDQRG